MATPHTIFRLDETTKSRLGTLAERTGETMTDVVKNLITEAYEAEMTVKSVFFGIMVGDLFADDDETVDVDASVRQYAEHVEAALKARYGDIAVEWDSQNATGVVPYGLKTRVNGETDHPEVEAVNILIGEVWQGWEWAVYETA